MLQLPAVTISDRTSGAVVGDRIRFADTALARLIGLLGAPGLRPGEGLLLSPSSGIHTIGMSYPIDVIALDRARRVRHIWHSLPPWRVLRPSPRTRMIIELPAGSMTKLPISVGDELFIELSSTGHTF